MFQISNGQLDLENVRMYLASMIKYLSDKHNFVYDEENNEIGISCAEEGTLTVHHKNQD